MEKGNDALRIQENIDMAILTESVSPLYPFCC
jgi:hypothetical protein